MTLFDGWNTDPEPIRQFQEFHESNPQVFRLFVKFAKQAIGTGRTRFSGRTIMERVRWYTSVETNDPAGFKVNDHWAPFYVRLFEIEFPRHKGFFEKRRAYADRM